MAGLRADDKSEWRVLTKAPRSPKPGAEAGWLGPRQTAGEVPGWGRCPDGPCACAHGGQTPPGLGGGDRTPQGLPWAPGGREQGGACPRPWWGSLATFGEGLGRDTGLWVSLRASMWGGGICWGWVHVSQRGPRDQTVLFTGGRHWGCLCAMGEEPVEGTWEGRGR